MTETLIRQCDEADVPVLISFIRALAEYEKLSHEVTTDEDGLRDSLFGEAPKAFAILAERDRIPVGFAIYFYNFSTFIGKPGLYVEDLFVLPEQRGHGIGKELLQWLARKAIAEGCGRMEWWVLDWNEPSIGFYRALGAMPMDEWTVFRITKDRLRLLGGDVGIRREMPTAGPLFVVAAALIDPDGRVLLAERPEGKAMAGLWEFPGGKVHADETPEQALKRELREELGIRTSAGCFHPVSFVTHPLNDAGLPLEAQDMAAGCDPLKSDPLQLPEDTLLLLLYACRHWSGTPSGREGQALRWVLPREMRHLPMPPADTPLVAALLDIL